MTTKTTEVKVLDQEQNSSFGLIFTPATIEMTNYDEMKQVIAAMAKRYDGLVITKEHKKAAEQSRSELIALEKSIEEERKAVKRKYNEPLQAYEEQMKALTAEISGPLTIIRNGLAEIEENEKLERETILNAFLADKLEGLGIELETPKNWLNKGNFTQKGLSTKLEKEIDEAIALALKEKEQREVNEKVIRTFCETVEVEPEGWLAQLDYKSPTEIMQTIQDKQKADKERAERIERERAELAAQEESNSQLLEIEPQIEATPLVTNVIEVTGTLSQLNDLNEYMKQNGIKVAAYQPDYDPYAIDDLPF